MSTAPDWFGDPAIPWPTSEDISRDAQPDQPVTLVVSVEHHCAVCPCSWLGAPLRCPECGTEARL